MRIAQLAPLSDTVPPRSTSPVQELIHHLVEALTERGHDVTLFASTEPQTPATLHALPAVGHGFNRRLEYAAKILLFERGLFSDESFEVIHSHLDCLALPFARRACSPVVTTVYDALDCSRTTELYAQFNDLPLVSHSERRRSHVPTAQWVATIYPGLPEDSVQFRPNAGGYLAYLGPPSSRPLHPLLRSLSHETGIPFRMAGVLPAHYRASAQDVRRQLERHSIEYIGALSDAEEEAFLGEALAVILPEGSTTLSSLTAIKALACGTPLLTVGAHPDAELIEHGITGFICARHEEMAWAVTQAAGLDRRHCRDAFEANFTLDRMVEEYLTVYKTVRDARTSLKLQ
jgi:glycosyltransferase involved in cell wall biosynthesis